MNVLHVIISKFKEVFLSVFPIVLIVLILNFTIVPLETVLISKFIFGSILVIFGLTVFLLGIEIGVTPFGYLTGVSMAKTNKLWIVLAIGLILGFFVSIAEPGLVVFVNQISLLTLGKISNIEILVIVSLGLAIMLSLGFVRIFYNVSLSKVLIFLYISIFIISVFISREFLAISFDASGSTTGVLAVPFILSISVSVSKLKKDSKVSESYSFGLVSIASTGAIISVMILSIFSNNNEFYGDISLKINSSADIFKSFVEVIPKHLRESFIGILPLVLMLLILQKIYFKLNMGELRKLFTGFLYTFFGLFMFLLGVNGGFIDVGNSIGNNLVLFDNKLYIIIVGFILGVVTILAEPAVYVLIRQIEEVTSGYIKRKVVLVSLSIGVGLAVALSVIRILVPNIQLWHYLLPGYFICILMIFFISELFVGIAFDTGGVATGPMTSTFILSFIQGAAHAFEKSNLIVDGFGMIAMVAMIPIIILEFLGLLFIIKSKAK